MTSPLPAALLPFALPASWLYSKAIKLRNNRLDKGVGVKSISRPVISVGNITLGGTGKTPMVMWIIDTLLKHGHKPVIAMRGYGAKSNSESDEALQYKDRFSDKVPIVVNPNRVSALQIFFSNAVNNKFDCVVLDDGFQHRKLHRDLDIVLIDATQDTFNDLMFPAGRLREPLTNLRRADVVILTRCNNPSAELAEEVKKYHGNPPLAHASHKWFELNIYGIANETKSVDWLNGKLVSTLFGTGNPKSIEDAVTSAGAAILSRLPASDHQVYTRAKIKNMISRLSPQNDALITTHKDWVKIRSCLDISGLSIPVVVPELSLNVNGNSDELKSMLIKTITSK